MSRETIVADWTVAIDAFNRGNSAPMMALYTDKTVHATDEGVLPSTGKEIVSSIYEPARKASGWWQEILSIAAEGEFMTSLYRNHFADGSSVLGCGLARLDEAGNVIAVHSFAQAGAPAAVSRG